MIAVKWQQMIAGLLCMGAISSPQYVWTLFTPVLKTDFNTNAAALQITFSLLIVLQTLFSPIQGWIAQHIRPRSLIMLGIIITGASWVVTAHVHSLNMLYLTYGGLGGVGTGIVYVGVVSLLMQWFPKNRGMAAGAAAAGYGMGAMVTTFPISHLLAASGWRNTMTVFGLVMIVAGLIAAFFLKTPVQDVPQESVEAQGYTTGYVVKTPLFWLMFFMMATMATSGLMVTSQLAQIASDFGVAHLSILGLAALPLAMTLDRVANGVTRPLFGWVSDHLGREQTMAFAFTLEAIALTCWLALANHPVAFVLLSGVVFLGWGEIFSLFPATLTDTFGTRDASRNYGLLYMAQGVGAIFGGPLAAWLHQASGNWHPVFALAIGGDLLTAFLAFAVLRPMRRRFMQSTYRA
ncbi:oxalate/formate MFS antiporter [Acetobacter orientalis]|uniref:oxalate/formate MFS antiporter n=1 Tax=Acetobacter orientalis TaxID=146474 RepID=UPI002653AAC4|nr:oxalate/formate MFS antiporter [Acetobacter sp.]